MRMSGFEDFALPLTLVFAVAFCLTLRQAVAFPSAARGALAATEAEPDYVMTITAKRLPAECKRASHSPSCDRLLAGDVRIDMHKRSTRLASRAPQSGWGY